MKAPVKPIIGMLAIIAALASSAALAQAWPAKPIRVFVGYLAGSGPDLIARITSSEIGKNLNQTIVVETRAGGGGQIATRAAFAAEPDGYTMVLAGSLLGSSPIFVKDNPIIFARDVTPIVDVATVPQVLMVRAGLAKTWQELVAYSKANPGKLNFGSIAPQTDLWAELLKSRMPGLTYTPVRYKAPPIQELLKGEVDFYLGTSTGLTQHFESGRIVPLLFLDKSDEFPNVPNAVVLGILPVPLNATFGYYGPKGIPGEITQKFSQAALTASKAPSLIEQINKLGLKAVHAGPEQQLKYYQGQYALALEAAKMSGLKPE